MHDVHLVGWSIFLVELLVGVEMRAIVVEKGRLMQGTEARVCCKVHA